MLNPSSGDYFRTSKLDMVVHGSGDAAASWLLPSCGRGSQAVAAASIVIGDFMGRVHMAQHDLNAQRGKQALRPVELTGDIVQAHKEAIRAVSCWPHGVAVGGALATFGTV
jgi:hypothetical protein